MAKDLFRNKATNDSPTHEDFTSHLRKHIADKEGEQIVAKPIDIFSIIPDVTQPRRAIPFSVRRSYENAAHNVPPMLEEWQLKAEQLHGYTIQVHELITGIEEIDIEEKAPALLRDYLDLISLAASIHREGLTNAITVSDVGDLKRIETGERRYLAHHLLTMYVDEVKYARIAAQTVTRDVWRQASENGARKPLNAIGLARQLALLIMDMYEGDRDVFFDKFEALILPGECDRKFYAQVANGNTYRIKRGMAQRILDVTGLKSKHQLYLYRNLLKLTDNNQINDILWTRADENNWTENALRDVSQIPINDIYSVITRENWSLDDLRVFLKTDDKSTAVDLSTQKASAEAPESSSVLPKRKEPSTTTHQWTTEPYRADPDPDLDEDAYTDDPEPPEADQPKQKPSKPAPPAHSNDTPTIKLEDPYIDNMRRAIAPQIQTLIAYAKAFHGREIVWEDKEPTVFDGKKIIGILTFYLESDLKKVNSVIKDKGHERLVEDLEILLSDLGELLKVIRNETVQHLYEVLDTAMDVYGN